MRILITQGGKSREFLTRRGTANVTVGRRPDCDIVIDSPQVSALHVKLGHFADRWLFTDQMSDTGTLYNGESTYSGELAEGDQLQVGDATLTVTGLAEERTEHEAAYKDKDWQQEIRVNDNKATTKEYARKASGDYTSKKSGYTSEADDDYTSKTSDYTSEPAVGEYHKHGKVEARTKDFKPAAPSAAGSQKPGANKQKSRLLPALLPVVIIGIVIASVVVPALFDDSDDEPRPSNPSTNSQTASQQNVITREMHAEFRKHLDILASPQNTASTTSKLEQFHAIEDAINKFSNSREMQYDLSRVSTTLLLKLRREVEKYYSEQQMVIYRFEQAHKYREALASMDALDTYLNQTPDYTEIARSAEMLQYVKNKRPQLVEANLWYVGEQFSLVDEALQRDDYLAAQMLLATLKENAAVEPGVEDILKQELKDLMTLANRQATGQGPKARPAFNRRADKLPPAPKNDLLPEGDNSSYTAINALSRRLQELWKEGKLDDLACSYYGLKAQLQPYDKSPYMVLKVTHVLRSGSEIDYLVRYLPHQLPPETTVSMYEAINPSRDELLGILRMCFTEGLLEDAKRVAAKLWHADESVKADLDQLLATKFKAEIPEGGFIEKDGKFVIE